MLSTSQTHLRKNSLYFYNMQHEYKYASNLSKSILSIQTTTLNWTNLQNMLQKNILYSALLNTSGTHCIIGKTNQFLKSVIQL